MNKSEVNSIIIKGIRNINNEDFFMSVINNRNCLYRYDIINRLLILSQCSNPYDIKTEEEWMILNRKVIDNSSAIHILGYNYTNKYIDNTTKEELDAVDLDPLEIEKALKYKIITKKPFIESSNIIRVYDIRNTKAIGDSEYKVPKPIRTYKNISKALSETTGCLIHYTDENTEYNIDNNELYLDNLSIDNMIEQSTFVLKNIYLNKYSEHSIFNKFNIDKYEISDRLCSDTIKYMISTLFNKPCEIDIDFSYIKDIDKRCIINVINMASFVVNYFIEHLEYNGTVNKNKAQLDIDIMYKAEKLLDIMEANSLNKKMKGA